MERAVYEKLQLDLAKMCAQIYDEGFKEKDHRKMSFASGIGYAVMGMDVIYNQTWSKNVKG